MKFMRYAFIILLFVTGKLNAQDLSSQLPVIIPPSPAIAAIANKTTLSGSMYTGAATVNVPLYDLNVGSLQLPIMLNYSSNGIKVNDIPSRVGLGWDLIAGGTISKVIHDEDDDDPATITMDAPNPSVHNYALVKYVQNSLYATYDTEFDEFSYNVAGLSGKFFFDRNGSINYGEKSDVKIERVSTGFVLTTGDGIRYEFKDVLEKTKELKFGEFIPSNKIKTTAWFLTKITSLEGDWIQFNYNPIQIKSYLGFNQTVLLKSELPPYRADPYYTSNCSACAESILYPIQNYVVEYTTHYLSTITTSNGYYVGFLYAPRPQPEQSKDNRLTGLLVYSTSLNKLIKKYKFEYQDFSITNDINQRFYLKKIYDDQIAAPFAESLVHTFDYITPGNLPSQKSLNQDFFGYANDANNVNYFFPLLSNYADYENGLVGANRNPHPATAMSGLLQKVTFPTGGYQSFDYEPHIISEPSAMSSYTVLNDPGINFIANTSAWSSPPKIVTRDIYINRPEVRFQFLTNVNPLGPDVGQPGYWTPDNVHPMSMLKIFDLATNNVVWIGTHFDRNSQIYEITLPANKTYRFEASAYSNSHAVSFWVEYNPTVNNFENKTGCGLRVKKINSYDPATVKSLQKNYFYSSIEDLCAFKSLNITGSTAIVPALALKSSGKGKLMPFNSIMQYKYGANCKNLDDSFHVKPFTWTTEVCNNITKVGSGSLVNQFLYNGSPIAYTSVIESEDENFTKGGVEHQFYLTDNTNSEDIINSYDDIPEGVTYRGNGLETFTGTYKSNGNATITLLNSISNVYNYGNYKTLKNFITRKRFEPLPVMNEATLFAVSFNGWAKPFDMSAYYHETSWNYLQKTISKTYDENGLNPITQTTEYVYDNVVNFKPTSISTTSSADNLTITKNFKYPGDFFTAPYPAMVTKHIINPVIEEQTLRDGVELAVNTTDYAAWTGATGSFYKPSTIKTKKAGFSTENRISFYAYDLYGNPQELSKVNDSKIAYLWNYKNSYPVAEVKNATFSDIAYTGFEGEDPGNWTYNIAGKNNNAFTGVKAFTGSLSKSVNNTKTYEVTLWTLNSATVNSLAGTQILTAKGSWKLYKWQISGVSNVTVSGTNMDDVRLYPKEAEMTSATYIPFIGKSSEMDAGGNVRFYEYDEFNRLRLIKDKDNNILKKYCYQYAGQTMDCELSTNTTAYWYPNGKVRCLPCPANNAYFSTVKEIEETDINPLSLTAGTTRWVTAANDVCEPIADWAVISTTCEFKEDSEEYSGFQITTEKDQNPCSATYNETRLIRLYRPEICAETLGDPCALFGPQYKLISSVCEEGVRKNISSVSLRGQWYCTYVYEWSDCTYSEEYTERTSSRCLVPLTCF